MDSAQYTDNAMSAGAVDTVESPDGVSSTPVTLLCHSAIRPRSRAETTDGSDNESIDSMPSMQTVSDSEDEAIIAEMRRITTRAEHPDPSSATTRAATPSRPSTNGNGNVFVSGFLSRSTATALGVQPIPVGEQRMARRIAHDGAESDGSLPSLQTVSESSDGGDFFESDSDHDDEDEDDDLPALAPPSDSELERVNALRRNRASLDDYEEDEDEDEEDEDDDNNWEDEAVFDADGHFNFGGGAGIPEPTLANVAEILGMVAPQGPVPQEPHVRGARTARVNGILNALASMRNMFTQTNGEQPHNDPKRAEIIVNALEVVAPSLVGRYEHLRRGHEADDCEGCAICRDAFLSELPEPNETQKLFDVLPYNLNSPIDKRILAFPCPGMHLFHCACISPWLARKTTCPTCRYDIDPDSLTLRGRRDVELQGGRPKIWSPPRGRGFVRWLERQERHREAGGAVSAPADMIESDDEEDDYADDADDEEDESDVLNPTYIEAAMGSPFGLPSPETHQTRPRMVNTALGSGFILSDDARHSMLSALTPLRAAAMGNEYTDDARAEDLADLPIPGYPDSMYEEDEEDLPPLAAASDHELSPLAQDDDALLPDATGTSQRRRSSQMRSLLAGTWASRHRESGTPATTSSGAGGENSSPHSPTELSVLRPLHELESILDGNEFLATHWNRLVADEMRRTARRQP